MIQSIDPRWEKFMKGAYLVLLKSQAHPFSSLKGRHIPEEPGVYLITLMGKRKEVPLYVGRSKNIRRRIYTNHLMGNVSNARLKNYLIKDKTIEFINDRHEAKDYIKSFCQVRWITEEHFGKMVPKKPPRHPYQVRGLLESYVVARLFPRYGIYEEH